MAEQSMKEQLCSVKFWRAVAAEFLATLIFVFVGVASCLVAPELPVVQIALCFGLAIATMVQCFGHISGGHINPAVTLALFCVKKVNILVTVFYILGQCLGGLVGAALLYVMLPEEVHGGFGVTNVSAPVTNWQGLLIEIVITFQLVFTIFATTDSRRTDLGGSASLAIGIAVIVGHLAAVRYTGASMNPARSFGPQCLKGSWDNHWIYWVGPIIGGILAAFLYEFIFEPSSSVQRLRETYSKREGNVPTDDAEDTREEDVALKERNGK